MLYKNFYVFTMFGALLLTSCSQSSDEQVTTVRETKLSPADVQAGKMSAADRFGFRARNAGAMAGAVTANYTFETPPGWQKLPSSEARPANLQVAGDPNAECYFSILSGAGGGLTANVNRWRQQMGLDPISEEQAAQLPREKLLGHDAVFVKFDGAFSGMGTEPRENYRLVGLIAQDASNAYFVKMTGPIPVIEGQEENFMLFAQSLRQAPAADPHAGVDMSGDPHAGMSGDVMASRWRWEAPEDWTQAPFRPMRVVTYTSGPNHENEAYLTELSAAAGDVGANINRWRQQMGQPPLTPEQIAELPKVQVFGQDAPMLTVDGTYTADMRSGTFSDYRMYGVVIPGEDYSLFVKMVGPSEAMEAERDKFVAFVESLTEAE